MRRLLAALCLLLTPFGAYGYTVKEDYGGNIYEYDTYYRALGSQPVIVDGRCDSACTMILSKDICVTKRAVFGFHSSYHEKTGIPSPEGNQFLMSHYPPAIVAWINAHGGLQKNIINLQGPELWKMVKLCH